jgi:hypothetical protein
MDPGGYSNHISELGQESGVTRGGVLPGRIGHANMSMLRIDLIRNYLDNHRHWVLEHGGMFHSEELSS